MWQGLRQVLARFRRAPQEGPDERRAASTRARFWADVREGELEAEAHSRLTRRLREERLEFRHREDRSPKEAGECQL